MDENCDFLIDYILKNNCSICLDSNKCPAVSKSVRFSHLIYWWQYGFYCQDGRFIEKQKGKEAIENFIDISFQRLNFKLSENRKLALKEIAKYFYSDQRYVEMAELIPQGIALLNCLKNKGYRLFILSNAPPNVFQGYQNKFPGVFSCFEGAIISGDVHLMKPNPEIYKLLLNKYKLCAKDCVFIDDKICQVNGAKKVGMQAVHFDLNDFKEVIYILEQFNILTIGD